MHERGHQHHPDQRSVGQDGQGEADAEHPHEGHLRRDQRSEREVHAAQHQREQRDHDAELDTIRDLPTLLATM